MDCLLKFEQYPVQLLQSNPFDFRSHVLQITQTFLTQYPHLQLSFSPKLTTLIGEHPYAELLSTNSEYELTLDSLPFVLRLHQKQAQTEPLTTTLPFSAKSLVKLSGLHFPFKTEEELIERLATFSYKIPDPHKSQVIFTYPQVAIAAQLAGGSDAISWVSDPDEIPRDCTLTLLRPLDNETLLTLASKLDLSSCKTSVVSFEHANALEFSLLSSLFTVSQVVQFLKLSSHEYYSLQDLFTLALNRETQLLALKSHHRSASLSLSYETTLLLLEDYFPFSKLGCQLQEIKTPITDGQLRWINKHVNYLADARKLSRTQANQLIQTINYRIAQRLASPFQLALIYKFLPHGAEISVEEAQKWIKSPPPSPKQANLLTKLGLDATKYTYYTAQRAIQQKINTT